MTQAAFVGSDYQLLRHLAPGGFCSGEDLARELGVTRAAVWKQVRTVRELGVDVYAVRGKGYRLERPLDLLDEAQMRTALGDAPVSRLAVLVTVDSTNAYLMARPPPPAGRAEVCVAEFQTAGRGRRGRRWIAPFGGGLCLSLSWHFPELPPQFAALSLAVGVGAARALRALGADGVELKWPNDLTAGGAKLGGILSEVRGEVDGPAHVVTGLGLNVELPDSARAEVEAEGTSAVIDLAQLAPQLLPGRSRIAAALTRELIEVMQRFATSGFASFREDWALLDAFAGQDVEVRSGGRRWTGVARGIDFEGALVLEVEGGRRRFISGEASLRAP